MGKRFTFLVVGVVCLVGLVGVAPALAAESAWWKLAMSSTPTVLQPGKEAQVIVEASNLGDRETGASPTTISVDLPSWMKLKSIYGIVGPKKSFRQAGDLGNMTCEEPLPPPGSLLRCSYPGSVAPYVTLEVFVTVEVEAGAHPAQAGEARIEGGETPGASTRQTFTTGESTPFGLERAELSPESEGGLPDTQAGSHPFQLTDTVGLNEQVGPDGLEYPVGPEIAKDLNIKLPPGLIGNANLLPQCDEQQFATLQHGGVNLCPADTAVGVSLVTIFEPHAKGYETVPAPIFNLTPSPEEPARFGWITEGSPVVLDTSVRTGSDYGVTVHVNNITQITTFVKSEAVFWGVPGASQHDNARGWSCVAGKFYVGEGAQEEPCEEHETAAKAFLTMPTSCAGNLQTSTEADSWNHPETPGSFASKITTDVSNSAGNPLTLDGCNGLNFVPTISVAPDGEAASTPTGLTVGVHVPQEVSLPGAGDAEADVKNTTVTLPEGVQLSPSAADGLQACSDQQIGFEGFAELDPSGEPGVTTAQFSDEEQTCPDAAKIAKVKIKTPLLPNGLTGAVYLAAPQNFSVLFGAPQENPFSSLVAMYLVAKDPVSGTLVKLPGRVTPNPVTGQITTTFENTPQLAFEDLELEFFGTGRAPLASPAYCGNYTTTTSIEPWSEGAAAPSSTFQITSGPNNTACAYHGQALPFSPSLTAETTDINAGNFSPLRTTISREDGQQNIQSVQLHFPPGVSGVLAGVPLCPEAQANAGTCGAASLLGSTIVSVGLGGDPFSVTGGRVYLTEKIAGSPVDAPFGLSIVNPANAGPFVLEEGRPVVVRAQVAIDPLTAALTVTTDDSGPYKIPSILDGIPLQIKHVSVTIERAGFTFNPTDCDPQKITGSVNSTEGASGAVAVPFQVTNCASLKFAPKFTVSTSGKTSKSKGASLTATLSEPKAPFGSQANITRVKVDLPKQLPSRLTTLQKACTAKQFELNPANCPKESKIGFAKVTTPLLPVPLEGPAIFVSHGGEAFPSLTMVLQGYGVTIDLVGTTFISKKGITSTTFKTVPDVPFNSFTLTLPEGKFSALAANGKLCKSKLAMPTEFLAQNGAKINESTKVGVTGCPKVKKASKAKKHGKRKSKGGKKK
jgi:hypothetical protein